MTFIASIMQTTVSGFTSHRPGRRQPTQARAHGRRFPIMGDLMSTSLLVQRLLAATQPQQQLEEPGLRNSRRVFREMRTPLPLPPRLSLILKSCFSSSNSETEFFLIRSMMALISFRSRIFIVRAARVSLLLATVFRKSKKQQPKVGSALACLLQIQAKILKPCKSVKK